MAALTLTVETYRDKILGGWQGKSIGITLGAPQRGQKIPGRNSFYNPVPGQPAASPALDFPLIWLHTVEETGPDLVSEDLAVAWLEHLDYSQDEFGYAALNLRRGLPPPAAGAHSNWFRHATGGVMRADFWAMLLPGAPQMAASYAYHDSILDHSEEGVWASMFLAALGSAAFFLSDPVILLTIGLAMIPRTCRTARAVKTVIAAWQRAASWLEARESVQHAVGHPNHTDAPQNMGFFALGLLYGRNDFGSSLCAAVNCGYDAEVVGGALGAVLGIMRGSSQLPQQWVAPIGDLLIPGLGLRDHAAPLSLHEVADRTVTVGHQFVEACCPDVSLAPANTPADPALERIASSALLQPLNPLPNSPLATETPPPTHMDGSSGAALPYMQPAQSQEQPLATDPNLIARTHTSPSPDEDLFPSNLSVPLSTPVSVPLSSNTPPTMNSQISFGHGVKGTVDPSESISFGAGMEGGGAASAEETGITLDETPDIVSTTASPSGFRQQAAAPSMPAPPLGMTAPIQPVDPMGQSYAPAPDPVDAIAWADSTRVKPLLVTPSNAMVSQAGPMDVIMDPGDSPTITYNAPKTLSFVATNRSGEPFSGKVTLLAPPGWQVAAPPSLGQRQYVAAHTGTFRADFSVRVPDNAARVDIANAVTLRFTPDNGHPPFEAEFLLLGASCWWTVGPFANFDGEGFDRSYGPEERAGLHEGYVSRNMQHARWERRMFNEATLNLEPFFQGSSGVVYGQTILRSPTAREARIVANSNSGVKVWLGGALVIRRFNREPFRPVLGSGNWAADIMLKAGDNHLFVKWVRGTEPFEFSLTLSDRSGRGLPEVGNTSW